MDPAPHNNRSEQLRSIKPFADFLSTLKGDIPIPILRDFALLVTDAKAGSEKMSFLKKKINRIYFRLCRLQEELGGLDFKKAYPGVSSGVTPEDYVFSRIDFSRYREITEVNFESIFLEGIPDFSSAFFRKNFGLGKDEIHSLINECYGKTNGAHKIKKENPLILSVMRTLEISLETSPLFTSVEIQNELNYLQDLVGTKTKMPDADTLFSLLVSHLENASFTHKDNMITKLFISPQGDLSGTFRPGNKPWTRVLVPANPNLPLSLPHKIHE